MIRLRMACGCVGTSFGSFHDTVPEPVTSLLTDQIADLLLMCFESFE